MFHQKIFCFFAKIVSEPLVNGWVHGTQHAWSLSPSCGYRSHGVSVGDDMKPTRHQMGDIERKERRQNYTLTLYILK